MTLGFLIKPSIRRTPDIPVDCSVVSEKNQQTRAYREHMVSTQWIYNGFTVNIQRIHNGAYSEHNRLHWTYSEHPTDIPCSLYQKKHPKKNTPKFTTDLQRIHNGFTTDSQRIHNGAYSEHTVSIQRTQRNTTDLQWICLFDVSKKTANTASSKSVVNLLFSVCSLNSQV
jgi:hypothetical protein